MGELFMTKRKYVVSWLILVLSLWFTPEAIGYDANFHLRITEEAINLLEKDEDKSLGNYLDNNLGFENGLDKKFTGLGGLFYGPKEMLSNSELQEKSVKEWIKWGSKKEDHPDSGSLIEALVNHASRASKHFYNPLTGQGLTDRPYPGESVPSLNWAHNNSNNEYSWAKAREYYFKALTSQTKEERDENFAKTFRALGQALHLLQDKAVPAHTRNDNHLYMPPYGDSLCGQDMYEDYWKGGVTFPDCDYPVIEFEQLKSGEVVKFEDFWDTDVGKGLAEYANHNFVSRDTNLDVTYGIHNYVYPFKTGEHREDFTFTDRNGRQRTVRVTYIHTNATDNYDSNRSVIPFEYLTVYSFFNCYTEELGQKPVYTLNRKCHEEYGKLLLPRAAGYSAGLLNYFFRGKFKVEMEYIPDTIPLQYKLTITNKSGEKMEGGTLDLYYMNEDEEWSKVPDFSSNYSGTLEDNGEVIAKFTVPSNIFYPETYYTLVFKGKLGQEEDAVIGKAIKLEPLGAGWQSIGIWGETATVDPERQGWIPAPPVWVIVYGPDVYHADEICGPITFWNMGGSEGFETVTPVILRIVYQFSTAGLKKEDYDRFYLQGYLVDTYQNQEIPYTKRGKYPAGGMKVYKTDVSKGWSYVWNNTSEVILSGTVPSTWKFYSIEIPKEMINFEGTTDFVFMLTDESGETWEQRCHRPWGDVRRHADMTDLEERFLNSYGWRLFRIKTGSSE